VSVQSPVVNVQNISDRTSRWPDRKSRRGKRPWLVRWTMDGKEKTKSFANQAQAEDFHHKLTAAAGKRLEWDERTKEPVEWEPRNVPSVAECARQMIQDEWDSLVPNTRRSLAEALTRFVVATASTGSAVMADARRKQFRREMNHYWEDTSYQLPKWIGQWLLKWSPRIDALTSQQLSRVDRAFKITDAGTRRAESTYRRYRSGGMKCMNYAVAEGYIESFDWPKAPAGVNRRKKVRAQRVHRAEALKGLPNRDEVFALLDALENFRPESFRYRAMSAVAIYAGLRPAEVAVLEVSDFGKTRKGAAFVRVEKTWGGSGALWGTNAEDVDLPKTGTTRRVLIPTQLVDEIDSWKKREGIKSGPLFLGTNGQPPVHWNQAVARACRKVEIRTITPYGLRHTNATLLMEAGVPLGVIAERLGNSVDVLVNHYLGYLQGSEESGEQDFERFLDARVPLG
jgi:integrase